MKLKRKLPKGMTLVSKSSVKNLERMADQLLAKFDALAVERDQLTAERDDLAEERTELAAARDALKAERNALKAERNRLMDIVLDLAVAEVVRVVEPECGPAKALCTVCEYRAKSVEEFEHHAAYCGWVEAKKVYEEEHVKRHAHESAATITNRIRRNARREASERFGLSPVQLERLRSSFEGQVSTGSVEGPLS